MTRHTSYPAQLDPLRPEGHMGGGGRGQAKEGARLVGVGISTWQAARLGRESSRSPRLGQVSGDLAQRMALAGTGEIQEVGV